MLFVTFIVYIIIIIGTIIITIVIIVIAIIIVIYTFMLSLFIPPQSHLNFCSPTTATFIVAWLLLIELICNYMEIVFF